MSCFGHLSSSNTIKSELVYSYYQRIDEILVLLKPALEEAIISPMTPDEKLKEVLVELDGLVDKASKLIGSWHQMMSKVYFVLQIEPVTIKIRASAVVICQLMASLCPSTAANATSESIQTSMKIIQQMHNEYISDTIREVIRCQIDKRMLRSDHLEKIMNFLKLSTNQELLMEAVGLDKLKFKVVRTEDRTELEYIDQITGLITYMHDCLVKMKQLHSIDGVPIPTDFCCPLSLELMSDPVIVASGQTYERAYIKKWLDQGFNVCPKTRQTLAHTNLIPNFTVKALIANWCESNNIKLPDPLRSLNLSLPSALSSVVDTKANDVRVSYSVSPKSSYYAKSLEPNISTMNMYNDRPSSKSIYQESYPLEKPPSPHHNSTLMGEAINGIGADNTRITISGSEDKDLGSKERGVSSGIEISTKSNQCISQDDQIQEESHNVFASDTASTHDYSQTLENAIMGSHIHTDLTHDSIAASSDVMQEALTSSSPEEEPEFPIKLEARSRSQPIWRRPSERFVPRIISSSSMDCRPNLSGVENQVQKLVEDLRSDSVDEQRAATAELRLLARHNMENRIVIANCGAIPLLVRLLHSADSKAQENAVTALLNLSINDNNKTAIANADAIDPLIHVLETGNPEAKENSAATLFSLSVIEENKVRIGRSGAIKPLVDLLGNGTPRGKKDAATALFNLSIFHENKARIVQAGAVRHLVELMDPAAGMVDKAVAVLANLATIPEGRTAIGHEGGIPVLVEVVELGSSRGKENAAAALLQLCTNSNRFCSLVLQEGAVPPLVALSQSGTPRAKEKVWLFSSVLHVEPAYF
ncbi:U-box domain-containing protein 4 [Apostasia shenzhenica]|uniref:RING-type E3 ubiquitin transferase n=1 Tax=Apostasia shenzhenica TaxID=1088818 RepID=A0A2I0B8I9_9ASPA|nr:U-box domain-containing protein 4 [Apostasia shenzhenica]